jgi:ABC-2 type transport system permease protein
MKTLFLKELVEQWRTWKLVILLAVFLISGLISPVLAKYTPVLLSSIPDLPTGFADLIPEPTVNDAVTQYTKNINQFGILLVIVLNMGAVVQEKERGTVEMLLTKPVRRSAVILSKWTTSALVIVIGILIAGIGCALYTALLFEPLPPREYFFLNLLLTLNLTVYMSIALLASTIAKTQTIAAALAFGGLATLLILGAIPRVNEYSPGKLLQWGDSMLMGGDISAWPALFFSLLIIVITTTTACLYFEKEEI